MALDKSAILAAMAPKKETVSIPGGDVIVSEITAADFITLYTNPSFKDEEGNVDMAKFTRALLAAAIVDEDGNRLFTDEDADTLGKGSHAVFHKLSTVARRLNGFAGDEVKNSGASQS